MKLGGEPAKVGGDAARAGGDAVKVGGDAAKVGGDVVKVGGDAVKVGGDAAKVGEDAAKAGGDVVKVGGKGVKLGGDCGNAGGRLFAKSPWSRASRGIPPAPARQGGLPLAQGVSPGTETNPLSPEPVRATCTPRLQGSPARNETAATPEPCLTGTPPPNGQTLLSG